MLNKLLTEINNLNNKYPKIDYGACGTFSYYLSEKLNSIGVENQIVYIPEENTPKGSYRCDVKFHHILIKIDDILIDNFGIRRFNNILPLDKNKLSVMLEDKKLWNNVFPQEEWQNLATDIL